MFTFKKSIIAITASAALMTAVNAYAWKQETHRQIVLDAVSYMKANPSTTQYNRLKAAANAAGYTISAFAAILGQGAYDVDDFQDTYICGAITGDCEESPVWGLASSIVKYTSYFHFQNYTQGMDVHGNEYGGYNYSKLTVGGTIDNLAAAWLWDDYMDDGHGGMKGWWWRDHSKYNTYGITEAHYRQGSYSNKNMYSDFQNMPFQPIDNLGEYWYKQFLAHPSAQILGFVLHTTDLLEPHHVWVTSSHNHSAYEAWARDNYHNYDFNNFARVKAALNDFMTPAPGTTDIRPLLTEGGAYAYQVGGIVLSSQDQNDRIQVTEEVIPHAIAMVVKILNLAALRF